MINIVETKVDMKLIDGKKISAQMREEIKARISALAGKGIYPGLATILVGEDPASSVYVSSKIKTCEQLGIKSFHHQLPATITEEEIISLIRGLNEDPKVNGILLQLPLPNKLNSDKCINEISPKKDVDGLTPTSIGKLVSAKSWKEIEEQKIFIPCTPFGIIIMLKYMGIEVAGKNAVVIGRSNLAGKPIAQLLLSKNATVTIAHSKTSKLDEVCRGADILVAAIGKPKFVTKSFVKPGAVVIDIGINRDEKGLCGDVDFDDVKDVAGYLTPVPGGVGAMTITMLMYNTVQASE